MEEGPAALSGCSEAGAMVMSLGAASGDEPTRPPAKRSVVALDTTAA